MARPKGSRNEKTVEHVEAPRCPDCQSTDATVVNTDTQTYEGLTEDGKRINFTGQGKPFNRIVRRRLRCNSCDRRWLTKTLEFVPDEEQNDEEGK